MLEFTLALLVGFMFLMLILPFIALLRSVSFTHLPTFSNGTTYHKLVNDLETLVKDMTGVNNRQQDIIQELTDVNSKLLDMNNRHQHQLGIAGHEALDPETPELFLIKQTIGAYQQFKVYYTKISPYNLASVVVKATATGYEIDALDCTQETYAKYLIDRLHRLKKKETIFILSPFLTREAVQKFMNLGGAAIVGDVDCSNWKDYSTGSPDL